MTTCHKKENEQANEDAEVAYGHPDTPKYREKYISQLNTLYGPTIDGKVVVHKMGATVLRHPQINQYLRYWENRTGAGAWAYKTDIEGDASAYRRAQEANPNTVSSASYKWMGGCRVTHGLEHQLDHRYDPSELTTRKSWSADTIDAWMSAGDGEVADTISQLLNHEGVRSISEVTTKGRAIDAQALSTLTMKMSEGLVWAPPTRILGPPSIHGGFRRA